MSLRWCHARLGTRLNSTKSYVDSLHLPSTNFGPKFPLAELSKELIHQSSENFYKTQLGRNTKPFTLHDGPPYANGDLHLGHALNKILKDLINRFESLYTGKKIIYQPGWDCHGLPIEMKALENLKLSNLTPTAIRESCRNLAKTMIDKQREQFKDFAIMTNFEDPYITMSHEYEINQLNVFVKLLENGLLSRQLKPVWWGPETFTALAEAELVYNPDHISTAIFVKFPLTDNSFNKSFDLSEKPVKLLIWTSTPWTIPANKATCIHKDVDYTLIENDHEYLVIAKALTEDVLLKDDSYKAVDITFKGAELKSYTYTNPAFSNNETYAILHGPHVTTTAGSGLVHTAPAHGVDDYNIGREHGLVIESAVNGEGKYIEANIPQGFHHLKDLKVTKKDTIKEVISLLTDKDMIYHVNPKFKHSYPYDWRSKTPVIQRATPQWFVDVEKIKSFAIESLEKVQFIPESGKNRLPSFIQNRSEWCISRQRTWGVPLPIIYHKQSDEPIQDLKIIKSIVNKIEEFGTDEWFVEEKDISRWLPEELKDKGTEYVKGKDTMDVWFDSGTSWNTLENGSADVYLEGSDQHRGWFQSSLLTKIVSSGTNGKDFKPEAPFKKIITHGFILDKKNRKMSKSVGNVISPKHVIEGGGKPFLPKLGTDGLRLWVASSDYSSDVNVTPEVLTRVFDNIKKFRVTFKYILGNLKDFDIKKDAIPYEKLNPLDKYTLSKLYSLQKVSIEHYKDYSFSRVVNEINNNLSSELSAKYFDSSKDCLYTDKKDSHRRRSIQTVLYEILKTYIGLLAPIQPLLTQEVWNHFGMKGSPFEKSWDFYQLPKEYENQDIESQFEFIWNIRNIINISVANETQVKNKLELQINLKVQEEERLREHAEFLDDYFLVSKVSVNKEIEVLYAQKSEFKGIELEVEIGKSPETKCARCWKYTAPEEKEICPKCDAVVDS